MPTLRLPDGRTVPVADGLVLGRIETCDLVLDDEKASRKHARIVLQSGVAEVEDLGSRNGVLLNGSRVLRRVLRDGDRLTIGRTEIDFVGDPPGVPAAGPAVLLDEDLLGDVTSSADPRTGAFPLPQPRPVPAPVPAPKSSAKPEPQPEPGVELIEFVDEVVEVRKRPAPGPGPAPSSRPTGSTSARRDGVLQFSRRAPAGPLGDDVGQLGGLPKLLIVLTAIAVAVGLGWVAMRLAG